MSYHFYLFLHLVSLFAVTIALSATAAHILSGGDKQNFTHRKAFSITHGVSLLIAFISGFGLMARAQHSFSSAPWLYGKILCWLILGVLPVVIYKKILPRWGNIILVLLTLTIAIALVTSKPI